MSDWQPFDWFLSSDGDYGVVATVENGEPVMVLMVYDADDDDTRSSYEAAPERFWWVDGTDIPEKYRNVMADHFKYTIEDIT